jgi:hypothetical protein
MRPDRSNYEIWLIDYLDGNLDRESSELLMIFLEANPDIREELNDLLSYKLNSETGSFRNKETLKKSASDLNESQFELLCVAAAENDLSDQQTAELNEIVSSNPERQKTFELIKEMKLKPPKEEFRFKYKLRKLTLSQKIVRISVIGLSAAASIFLAVTIYNRQPVESGSDIVYVSKAITPEKTISAPEKSVAKSQGNQKIIKTYVAENLKPGLKGETTVENKAVEANFQISDTSVKTVPEKVEISSISFRPEVRLVNPGSEAGLIALNMPETVIPEEPATGFNGFIARVFRNKILRTESPGKGNLKAYEIADAGINGLNRLLGWEMSLQKNKDVSGDVKSVYFNSKLLKFNAPVKKVQPLP